MAPRHSEEFKREAVRLARTSGLTRRQISFDLGIGLSTLGKWIARIEGEELPLADAVDLARENERLRREIRVLREEREVLKKATVFFAGQKP